MAAKSSASNSSNTDDPNSVSRETKRPRRSRSSKGDDVKDTMKVDMLLQNNNYPSSDKSSSEPPRTEEDNLRQVAGEATVVEFDSRTGLPLHQDHFLPDGVFDPIRGIVKKRLPPSLFEKLVCIHKRIQQEVDASRRVPWAGINDGDAKVRAFGFLGESSWHRLDHESAVRLVAPEKEGQDAIDDETANRKAICILDMEDADLDVEGTTKEFINFLNPNSAKLDSKTVCPEELIAYQINMHNGMRYLPAHLDWPLHEGFGKVIVTVAIRGDADVLLIAGDTIVVGGEELQPAWRFHLEQGECYVLSDRARNRCLHAVVANEDNNARESLNLRFGLHTEDEARHQITKYWADQL
ncbi:hypothetical protein IV203_003425 [Nitzschia inconspicua]|uniref:Uncharacterized protein n=1 Tax=Nitzschia inconspicua TaxID=303405 RepID=A0A9K3L2I4_9STRA|nr:hypothetical protein IV203_003425 [Nitzschia inconspicua]